MLKVNMLAIIQHLSSPWWSHVESQLQADKLSLYMEDLNDGRREKQRKRGRPMGTTQQPSVGFELLDANNKP